MVHGGASVFNTINNKSLPSFREKFVPAWMSVLCDKHCHVMKTFPTAKFTIRGNRRIAPYPFSSTLLVFAFTFIRKLTQKSRSSLEEYNWSVSNKPHPPSMFGLLRPSLSCIELLSLRLSGIRNNNSMSCILVLYGASSHAVWVSSGHNYHLIMHWTRASRVLHPQRIDIQALDNTFSSQWFGV